MAKAASSEAALSGLEDAEEGEKKREKSEKRDGFSRRFKLCLLLLFGCTRQGHGTVKRLVSKR